MKKLVILIFTINLAFAFNNSFEEKIVGGNLASENEWSWAVAINIKVGSDIFRCGGSLIDKEWVISAGHCFYHDGTTSKPEDLRIKYGDTDLKNSKTAKVEKVIVHPNYNPSNQNNDIALLKLKEPIEDIDTIDYHLNISTKKLKKAWVVGWGATSGWTPKSSLSDRLLEVSFPIVDNETCQKSFDKINQEYNTNVSVNENMICAGDGKGGKDSCQGDSGGPLMIEQNGRWIQAGIVSWGVGCAMSNTYGVYTNVSRYINWIDKMIGFVQTIYKVSNILDNFYSLSDGKIEIENSKKFYLDGDEISFNIKNNSKKPKYLYIIYANDKKSSLIFPNSEYPEDIDIKGDFEFPNNLGSFKFKASGKGRDRVYAILSDDPLRLYEYRDRLDERLEEIEDKKFSIGKTVVETR